jgi:hypothetical protein
VYVIRAGAEFEQVSANPMGASALASPAISEGKFFGRTVKGIIAFRNSDEPETEDD